MGLLTDLVGPTSHMMMLRPLTHYCVLVLRCLGT
jgi:hypothetical protein